MPPVKSYSDTTLTVLNLQIKNDETEAFCAIAKGGWVIGYVTVKLVSVVTHKFERDSAAEDMAMGRRHRIVWRHIVRNRIAFNHDIKSHTSPRATLPHAVY